MKFKITPFSVILAFLLLILISVGIMFVFSSWIKKLDAVSAGCALATMLIFAAIYDQIQKRKVKENDGKFLHGAKLMLQNDYAGFEVFYQLYHKQKKDFLVRYKQLLDTNDNFDRKKLAPIELLFLFAEPKGFITIIDWQGEENEHEIQEFAERLIGPQEWKNSRAFNGKSSNHGDDTIGLLKAIDTDISKNGHKLLFLDMGWDAYVLGIAEKKVATEIVRIAPEYFHGIKKLN